MVLVPRTSCGLSAPWEMLPDVSEALSLADHRKPTLGER